MNSDSDSDSDNIFDSDNEVEPNRKRPRETETSNESRKASKPKQTQKNKKPKRSAISFFDEEASEASDDDDDDAGYTVHVEDKDHMDLAQIEMAKQDAARAARAARSANTDLFSVNDTADVEREAARFVQKYSQSRSNDNVGRDISTDARVLPDRDDPKLFGVRCKPGIESALCVQLMNKYLYLKRMKKPCGVFSASFTGVKSLVYVEGRSVESVKEFVNGLNDVWAFRKGGVIRVPLDEMTTVLQVTNKQKKLEIGQWVRFKRGIYKGDLGQVEHLVGDGQKVIVKVLPRVDLNQKGSRSVGKRARAQLFYPDEERSIKTQVSRKAWKNLEQRVMSIYKGNYYRDGFLFKEISILVLQNENVMPQIHELHNFNVSADDDGAAGGSSNLLDTLNSKSGSSSNVMEASSFETGDTVVVIEGELMNMSAIVTSINQTEQKVEVVPIHEEMGDDKFWLPARELSKFFKKGDRCKVVSGKYSGETGMIVHVDSLDEGGWIAILFTDGSMKEISVFMKDLSLSNEVAVVHDSLQGYELYDMIMINTNQIGVVVNVGREDLTVLVQTGEVKRFGIQSLRGKRNNASMNAAALDADNSHIQVKDIVDVVDGPLSGQSGSIKHMYRAYIFIQDPMQMANAGISVVRARHVRLAGSRNKQQLGTSHMGAVSPYASPMASSDGRAPMNRKSGGGRRRDDDILGKTVKIKLGNFKGYIGIVTDATDTMITVELHARSKKVKVKRTGIMVVGDERGATNSNMRSSGGFSAMGSSTPLYSGGMGSMTPMHGSMTPMHGSMTPMHGSMTPMHGSSGTTTSTTTSTGKTPGSGWNAANGDVWSAAYANTPANTDVSDDLGGYTPMGVGQTPGAVEGRTPYYGDGGYTPMNNDMGMTPGADIRMTPIGSSGYGDSSYGGAEGPPLTSSGPSYTDNNRANQSMISSVNQSTNSSVTDTTTQSNNNNNSNSNNMYTTGVVVKITAPSSEYVGREGYVLDDHINDSVMIMILDSSTGQPAADTLVANQKVSEIKLVTPATSDSVKIIKGENAGTIGRLISIDGSDGIVKLPSTDINIEQMDNLAKYFDPDST